MAWLSTMSISGWVSATSASGSCAVADRLAVDADTLGHLVQVRAGEAAGAPSSDRSRASIMMAVLPLPLVPAIWTTGVAALGRAEQFAQGLDPSVPGAMRCSGHRAMSRWTICWCVSASKALVRPRPGRCRPLEMAARSCWSEGTVPGPLGTVLSVHRLRPSTATQLQPPTVLALRDAR